MSHMANPVLIVEDDSILLRMYQRAFNFEGIDIETAVDGVEGLDKAKKVLPSLVLLDIMLPKRSGLSVLDELKKDPTTANIPVVVLSNLASEDDQKLAMEKGALEYIVKSGHDPKGVVEIAKKHLGTSAGPAAAPAEPAPEPQA